jgi:hypothetical protein
MAQLDPRLQAGLRLLATVAVLAAAILATIVRHGPPPPRGTDAPAVEFSAARASEVIRRLSPDGRPRPAGSAENASAASRLARRLRALGLEVLEQETFACGAWGICARVRNVAARVPAAPGGEGRRAVLLVAHHDSVWAGPGISDDLSGVAALVEVGRALRAGPSLPRPVVLLSTDGEELGLVGIAAFAGSHPWAGSVGVAVNLEARGTSGPSVMFDTSGEASFLAGALRALPRPVTTSVAPALYDLIPNDTDLTVLQDLGFPGLNFAFAEGVVRYHTPRDDLAHLSPGSLQHQGENALAAVRALARADLEHPSPARAVFFDVLALGVVGWPEALGVPLAALALALSLGGAALLRLRAGIRLGTVAAGLAAATAAPILAGALAAGLAAALGAIGAVPRPFVAHPGPLDTAVLAAGAAGSLAAAALAGRRSGTEGHLAGAAILLALLALAASVAFPGGSYLFLVPSLACAAAAIAWPASRRPWVGTVGLAAAALSALPSLELLAHLPPMLGAPAAPAVAGLAALAVLPVASAAAGLDRRGRWRAAAATGAAALFAAATAAALPHATPDAPERMSVVHHEEAGRGRLLVEAEAGELPAAMRALGDFPERPGEAFAWLPLRRAFAAGVPAAGIPAPRAEVLSTGRTEGGRRVLLRLVSPRGAPALLLALPPGADLRALSVEGVPAPRRAAKARSIFGGWRLVGCATSPPGGIELDLLLGAEAPVDAVVLDQSPGLPAGAARVAAARPAEGVASQEGDVTMATAKVRL